MYARAVINEATVAPQIEIVINDLKSNKENFIEAASAEEIATQLRNCQTWSDITAITSTLDKATRIQSWAMLDKSEKQRILDIKEEQKVAVLPQKQPSWFC